MRIVVWGTGQTGLMTAREMIRQGHEVRLVDENVPDTSFDVPVKALDKDDMAWADLVIPSPGVPRDHPMFSLATKVLSEIEVASSLLEGEIIAVTGTNGKTTTTTLIHEILKKAGLDVGLGGNISPPLISLVRKNPRYIVAEISSFQLEWIEHFRPLVGICMNITPDHLDRYHDMDEYVAYKLKLFENQQAGDFAIINDADAYLKKIDTRAKRIGFSLDKGASPDSAYIKDSKVVFTGSIEGEGPMLPDRKIFGLGVMEDMLAAAVAARVLGIDSAVSQEVFKNFSVIHHRLEYVATIGGVVFIDDSKATNVGAVDKALSGTEGKTVVILGGKDKGGDFSQLAARYKDVIKKAVIIGEATGRIVSEISDHVDCVSASDMNEAVRLAFDAAVSGDTVLLSPGCSSFDMFKSYAERGDVFVQCVKTLR